MAVRSAGAPSRDYDGRFGQHRFRKHFYSRIGDLDSKEEFEGAVWLDTQAQKGRLQYWVRNLARREGVSFFLQKARVFVQLAGGGIALRGLSIPSRY